MKRMDATSSSVGKLPLRGRKPWRAVATSAGEQRPGNASHLVGKRYGHDLERSPCQELRQPGIFLRVMFGPPQHSVCPDPVKLEHVLGDIQTDRGNLHVDGSLM